ncbi:MAG: HNH endonuclease signature motif containing protein [bacterium]|nr:HNH endonuclease signature motif containing protein [bacterium]
MQKGMNFRNDDTRLSVFLMSARRNAPYKDEWDEEKQLLIYEGHDLSAKGANKKSVDQPMTRDSGRLSDNGKFYKEAIDFKGGVREFPLQIQVYEKLDIGVWFDKGIFNLIDARYIDEDGRKVFKFYLTPADGARLVIDDSDYRHERMIPTSVKVEVWKRDKGICRECGANTGLHYDHILPYSKGGRSDDVRNVQILCARHNLQKGAKIQ